MNENVNVCITPKGDKPVLHFSQFDNKNVFTVTVLADDGVSAAVLTGLDIEFRLRKTDSHVVTIAPESVADNVITFKTTEQLCACCGQNIASVVLMKDDMIISTLDILVDIQRDILSGGLTSESDIRNLTTQIEQIVPEVVGDDYYTKTEVDDLIDDIPTFDPTNYYDKQEVDDLIAEHTFDPSNYYDKSDVDGLLADKADSDDVYNKTETDNLLSAKMDTIGYHGIVDDAAVISFTTDCNAPLDIIKGKITPVQSGSGTPSPQNVRPISGFSALNVHITDGYLQTVHTKTVNFGQVIYGGIVDVTRGILLINRLYKTYNGSEDWKISGAQSGKYRVALDEILDNVVYPTSTSKDLDCICNMFVKSNAEDTYRLVNGISYQPNYGLRIYSSDFDTNDITLWKSFLSNNPLTVVYNLSTPIEITTTPETVPSIVGVNNIFLDTGNLTEIAYFEGAEDNLIKLIKACQI